MFGRTPKAPTETENGTSVSRRDLLSVGEDLPGLASELTETLRMDWLRTTGSQEGKDRLQSVCFRYGQRLGELNVSPSRTLARLEGEIDLLRDESVRTSHSRLSSVGAQAWSLLHHDFPALARRKDQLQEECTQLQSQVLEFGQKKPYYWHRLTFFIVPAIALLASELAMGEEITKNALRLSGKLYWLFMAALLALPLVFKQILDWEEHKKFVRTYLVALVVLVAASVIPLASLRSEQAMRLVLKAKGGADASLADPFRTPASHRVPGAAGAGEVALAEPFTPSGNDPFAPTVSEFSGDDPFASLGGGPDELGDTAPDPAPDPAAAAGTAKTRKSTLLTITFVFLGFLFPMLSGLAFSKALEQADFRHEGRRLKRRLEEVQKELGGVQAELKSNQSQLAGHQAETVTLVEGLGDSEEFADKAITELVAVVSRAGGERASQLGSRIEALRDLGLKEMSKRLAREGASIQTQGDAALSAQIKYYIDLISGIAQIAGGKSLHKLAQSRKSTLRTTLLDGYEAGKAAAFVLLHSYEPEEKLDMVNNRKFHNSLFRGSSERLGADGTGGGN